MIKQNVKELLEKVSSITCSKYDLNDSYVLEVALEELLNCYEELQDTFIEYDRRINEHYKEKQFDPYYEYGVSEDEFH